MNLVGAIVAAILGYALVVAGLITWSVFRPQVRGHTLGALLIVTVLPPTAIVLSYWRTIDPLDAAVSAVSFGGAVRDGSGETCTHLLGQASRLVDPAGGEGGSSTGIAPLRCPLQTAFVAPGSDPAETFDPALCWTEGRPSPPGRLCYRIGFMEFRRNGRPRSEWQVTTVERSIRDWMTTHPRQEVFTIGYVHGWRHGAGIGDTDVRRLRTIAAYSAAALDERCRVTGLHCGALVMALYLSWPAQVGPDGPRDLDAALAAPTFPSRKRVSDNVGIGILKTLEDVFAITHVATRPGDRTLLIGHSLGGNALLSAILDRMRARQDSGARPNGPVGKDVVPAPADLVVLLNPAAEERKLVETRRLEGLLASGTGSGAGSAWPVTTPPRMLILAARCEARASMTYARGKAMIDACDDVVEKYFSASQRWAEGKVAPLDLAGIGHLARIDDSEETPPPSASHSVEINYQSNRSNAVGTSYAGALNPRWRCLTEPGWLYAARTHAAPGSTPGSPPFRSGRSWTTGDGSVGERTLGLLSDVGRPGQANVQFQFPPRGRSSSGAYDRYDPIWSVDADPTAIAKHGGIASASLTCLYVKLLFDNPELPAAPDQFLCANERDYDRRDPLTVKAATHLPALAAPAPRNGRETSRPASSDIRPERCRLAA